MDRNLSRNAINFLEIIFAACCWDSKVASASDVNVTQFPIFGKTLKLFQ